ncbi:MAG: glycoside hydrolase family 38 C-terminal domain-containing protein, partial [Chloroflexota bacterium]
TVPLDDYLEIRPDRRETIEKLIRDGRLAAGPNYMLPDEFLIGGEAWVRNLMYGIRSARAYGKVMDIGYSPDAFGHIAHLPAILRGFGIESVLIWRGVGREAEVSEFRWQSPDGSEVLAVHFPEGYGYMAEVPENAEALAGALQQMRGTLEPYATTSHVLVPNGTDHLPAHSGLSQVIKLANKIMPESTFTHGTYAEFVGGVRKELGANGYEKLPVFVGEFRNSSRSNVLAGVLSTRIWLKQRYAQCEDLLARYAEPLTAWAHIARRAKGDDSEHIASDKGLLRQAWKLLLQNGPHDSVTGCSVDPVYDDVASRFERCEQIAEALIFDAHGTIAGLAAPIGVETAVVYNSEHGPRTDFATFRLPVRDDRVPTHVVDEAGAQAPLQVLTRGGHSARDRRERVDVAFVAGDVAEFGYKAYRIEYGEAASAGKTGGNVIENEFFRVTGEGDGTLTLEDKRSGTVLRGLNRFEDGGEGGDEYTYDPPLTDNIIREPSAAPRVAVTEAGPARWTLEVTQEYALPSKLTEDRKSRSKVLVPCAITSRVRLYPGVARVDIETIVDNESEDHRLRALFPSGVATERSFSEQHFGAVERPVGLPDHDDTWFEQPVATQPQKTFTDVSDGERGLMLANRGLPEYEVITEADGTTTLALTLLRCVSWLSREDLRSRRGHAGPGMYTPGAQMIGRWTYEYSLIPHAGRWEQAFTEAHRFARPLRTVRVPGGSGEWPREKSLLSARSAEIVMSTIKLAEDGDGIVARLYNIADEATATAVSMRERFAHVDEVDLNEENGHPAVQQGGAIRLGLSRNQIVTLKFEVK